jgi:uncharacterized membrane protein
MTEERQQSKALVNRAEAQHRVDQILVFREELDRLERDGVIALPADQRQHLRSYHEETLATLTRDFDVDTTVTEKQMSLGMRIVSLLGALALAASVFFFFYRIWGLISTPVQVLILIAAPLLAAAATEIVSRKEKVPYFTTLIGLIAFASFVLNLGMLGSIFGITPTQNALLVWGGFALALAYGYDLRILLVAGILCLLAFLSATTGTWCGMYWLSFGERPENFIPAGLLLFAVPALISHRRFPGFPGYYRMFGLLAVLLVILILSHWGRGSYLPWQPDRVETVYVILGFAASALVIWTGIHWKWQGITNLGSTFFVIQLYTKFFDWWWDWMPKYLFFLLLGLVAVLLLLVFQRMRTHLREAMV